MTEDMLDYWLRIMTPIFPENAWIVSHFSNGNYVIQIDWRLENNLHQPDKRSRKIQIIILEEAIDDYLDKNKAEQELSDIKMKRWISERYNHFNPDHGSHAYRFIPTDKWRISKDVLNT
ncbi:MAG: hypothetical protein FJ139_03340 [Deltaproteobacteria bacterium]|nr:hypothetical protein [Deltaproteobacteria bacterium]